MDSNHSKFHEEDTLYIASSLLNIREVFREIDEIPATDYITPLSYGYNY
jgi:hypothetical protein